MVEMVEKQITDQSRNLFHFERISPFMAEKNERVLDMKTPQKET